MINRQAVIPAAGGSVTEKFITIEGRGEGVSRFLVPVTNSHGAISITFADNISQFNGKDFTIAAQTNGTPAPCGTALLVNGVGTSSDGHSGVILDNVQVRGGTDPQDYYFLVGIDLTGIGRPHLSDVTISGIIGAGSAPSSWAMQTGLGLDNCYSPNLRGVSINSAYTGISHVNADRSGVQGLDISHCKINNVIFGINSGCPDIFITGCYIAYGIAGIALTGNGRSTSTSRTSLLIISNIFLPAATPTVTTSGLSTATTSF